MRVYACAFCVNSFVLCIYVTCVCMCVCPYEYVFWVTTTLTQLTEHARRQPGNREELSVVLGGGETQTETPLSLRQTVHIHVSLLSSPSSCSGKG